jgi:hypothetical protein
MSVCDPCVWSSVTRGESVTGGAVYDIYMGGADHFGLRKPAFASGESATQMRFSTFECH